jgi:hypothetical protein
MIKCTFLVFPLLLVSIFPSFRVLVLGPRQAEVLKGQKVSENLCPRIDPAEDEIEEQGLKTKVLCRPEESLVTSLAHEGEDHSEEAERMRKIPPHKPLRHIFSIDRFRRAITKKKEKRD